MPVSLDDLKPGMILATDLREPAGRLLLPARTELTERHLRYFRMWGVNEAEIVGNEPESAPPPPDPEAVAAAEAATRPFFRHADLSHPAVAAVFRYCVERSTPLVEAGRDGH